MGELVAPLAAAVTGAQQPVHGAHRAEVDPLAQQRGVQSRRRGVGEAFAVEGGQQRLLLLGVQGQRRARPRGTRGWRAHQRLALHARLMACGRTAPQAHGLAGRPSAQRRGEFLCGSHQVLPCLLWAASRSSNAVTFF